MLISRLDARQQAALSSGADVFISKMETSERVVEESRERATPPGMLLANHLPASQHEEDGQSEALPREPKVAIQS